jgi:alpha-tubulin suppressor-like RCC1 family protein
VDYPLAADVLLVYDNANKLYLSGGSLEYVSNVVLYKGETSYDATATVSGDAPLSKTILGGGTNYYLGSGYGGPRSFNVNNGDQTVLVAGAYGYNSNQGLIYIYERKSKNRGDWELKQTIYGNLGTNARFGGAVSINDTGDRIFVSADQYSSNTGRVLVYDRGSDGLFPDTPTHTLTGSNGSGYAFGFSIDCNGAGDKLIVGARNETATERGAHHLYELINGTWTRTYHRVEGNNNRRYGWAVAMNKVGDRIVVSGSYPNGWIWIFHYENGSWVQKTQISNPVASNEFGWYVSMNDVGDRVAVGCNTIRAYIYDYNGTSWSLFTSKTDNPTGHAGVTLTPKGDYIAIHGLNISPGGISSAGAAYIYQISDTGTLTLVRTFTGEASNDNLGWHVYMSDDLEVIVMGAKGNDEGGSDAGKLYVYSFDTWAENFYITQPGTYRADLQICGIDYKTNEVEVTGSITPEKSWKSNEDQIVYASDGTANNNFGRSCAMWGSYMVVGSFEGESNTQGAIYIYKKESGTWTFKQKISGEGANDYFSGYGAVDIHEDTIIVGAYKHGTNDNTGKSYIYTRSGETWSLESSIVSDDLATDDKFGISVSVHGDYAVVGAQLDDGPTNSGAGYIFYRNGTSWSQQQKLNPGADDENVGTHVSIYGDYVVLSGKRSGSDLRGRAHVYKRTGTSWGDHTVISNPNPASNDLFSERLSITDGYVAIGSDADDPGGTSDAGQVYVFKHSGTNDWTLEATIDASDKTSGMRFASGISMTPNVLVVGAHQEGTGGANAGAVYIYERSGTSWTEVKKVVASDATSGDRLGYYVGVNNDGLSFVAGAYGESTKGASAGAAYIFEKADIASLTFDNYNQLSLTNTPTYTSSKLAYYSNVYDVGTLTDKLFIDKTGEYTSLTFDTSSNVAYFSNISIQNVNVISDYIGEYGISNYSTYNGANNAGWTMDEWSLRPLRWNRGDRNNSLYVPVPASSSDPFAIDTLLHFYVQSLVANGFSSDNERFPFPTKNGVLWEIDMKNIELSCYNNNARVTGSSLESTYSTGNNSIFFELQCNSQSYAYASTEAVYIYLFYNRTSSTGLIFDFWLSVRVRTNSVTTSTPSTFCLIQNVDLSNDTVLKYGWYAFDTTEGKPEFYLSVGGQTVSEKVSFSLNNAYRNFHDETYGGCQVNRPQPPYSDWSNHMGWPFTHFLGGDTRSGVGDNNTSEGNTSLKRGLIFDMMYFKYNNVFEKIPKIDFDTYNKLSTQNITPTSTTLKYGSNTYDLTTQTDIYIENTGTYDAGIKASDKFALVSNVVDTVVNERPSKYLVIDTPVTKFTTLKDIQSNTKSISYGTWMNFSYKATTSYTRGFITPTSGSDPLSNTQGSFWDILSYIVTPYDGIRMRNHQDSDMVYFTRTGDEVPNFLAYQGRGQGHNNFQHLTIVSEDDNGTYYITLYVNGDKIARKNISANSNFQFAVRNLTFGSVANGGTSQAPVSWYRPFLYDGTLSDDDVKNVFLGYVPRVSSSGAVLKCYFPEGTTDVSGNGNDLVAYDRATANFTNHRIVNAGVTPNMDNIISCNPLTGNGSHTMNVYFDNKLFEITADSREHSSSTDGFQFKVANTFDPRKSSNARGWCTSAVSSYGGFPHYLTVKFPEAKYVSNCFIIEADPNGGTHRTSSNELISGFTIDASSDGSTWSTKYTSSSGIGNSGKRFDLTSPGTFQYWRLGITGSSVNYFGIGFWDIISNNFSVDGPEISTLTKFSTDLTSAPTGVTTSGTITYTSEGVVHGSSSYLTFPFTVDYDDTFSVSFIAKGMSTGQSGFIQSTANSSLPEMEGVLAGNTNFFVRACNTSTWYDYGKSPGYINNGDWTHYVYTLSPCGFNLYINGVLRIAQLFNGTRGGTLGQKTFNVNTNAMFNSGGILGKFKVFSNVIDYHQVTELYKSDTPGILDRIKDIFSFDGYNKLSINGVTPTSTTLTDPSGNTYDLTTQTDVYIKDTGTYEAAITVSDKFALVSNTVTTVNSITEKIPLVSWTNLGTSLTSDDGVHTFTSDGSNYSQVSGSTDNYITNTGNERLYIDLESLRSREKAFTFEYEIYGPQWKFGAQFGNLLGTISSSHEADSIGFHFGAAHSTDLGLHSPNVNLVYTTGENENDFGTSRWVKIRWTREANSNTIKLYIDDVYKNQITADSSSPNNTSYTDYGIKSHITLFRHDWNSTTNQYAASGTRIRNIKLWDTVDIKIPKLTHDGYNKLSIENITPTASTLRLDSNTYDIGTATDIYIEDTGTYEIETKDANTFALVSNVVGSVASPPSSTVNAGNFTLAFRHGTGTTDTSSNNCTLYSDMSTGDYDWGTVNSVSSTSTETTYNVTFSQMNNINYLVLAGGGGGGNDYPEGGGGGGGMLDGTETSIPGNTYDIVVGNGGTRRVNGTNSSFHTFTAVGGGAGLSGVGADGGSGGGGRDNSAGGSGVAGPPRQGYNGGTGYIIDYGSGGGGGGAGGNGGNAGNHVGGTGGTGRVWSFNNTRYGGGGGGGTRNSAGGSGGAGGGGNGGQRTADGSNGTNYLGGGGGCKANGGSGTVILNFDATQSSTPPRYFSFDTYNKLSIENITPTSTTLKYDSNTYDIGTATNIYIQDTGTYEIEAKSANTFAFASNVVSSVTRVEPVITGGYQFGHALTYDGKLYGWGENSNGELGVGDITDKTVPTLCTGIPQGEIVSIWNQSIRGQSRWAKTRDGRIWVTGDHDTYCLPGSSSDFTTFTDVSAEFGDYTQTSNNVVWASGSERATQVLMENGDVWSFGDDTGSLGVLGQGASPTSDRTPRKLNVSNITKITYGGDLVLALDSSNVIWMWGRNSTGNSTLGWGPYNVPTNIMSTGTNSLTSLLATDSETVVDIESSYYSMFALTDKGTVYCTGHNASGQLGQGNATAKTSSDGWVKIEYFTSNAITVNKLYVGGGNPHVFADTSDGWYCWGENTTGELGLGDNTDKLSPVKFTGVSNIKKFGVGYLVSYAITEDGKYYAWGRGTNYARGDNTTGDITYPKHIDTLPNILAPSFEFDGYDKVFVNKDGGIKTWTSGPSYIDHIPGIGSWDNNTFMPLYKVSDDGVNAVYAIQTYSTDHSIKYTYATKIWSDNGSNHPHYVTSNTDDPTIRESTPNAKTLVAMQDNGNIFYKFNNPFYSDSFENTKYTKGTTTYDVGEASIITVPDPGTYDAQLKSLFNFSLKSTTIPATSSTGLYTWAFHHGNFDNAYGDGDILTARDNGRFYADTPSYTGDIGTITPTLDPYPVTYTFPFTSDYPVASDYPQISSFTNGNTGSGGTTIANGYMTMNGNGDGNDRMPKYQTSTTHREYSVGFDAYFDNTTGNTIFGGMETGGRFGLQYHTSNSTLKIYHARDGQGESVTFGNTTISDGVWYNIKIVFDIASSVKIYLDNELYLDHALTGSNWTQNSPIDDWYFGEKINSNYGVSGVRIKNFNVYEGLWPITEDVSKTTYTFTPASTLTANVLMVAGGGGGGGRYNCGGGGAGGLVYTVGTTLSGTKTIVVGNGDSGGNGGAQSGYNGKDTTFTGLTTAVGGGYGGTQGTAGGTGGSGGGGGGQTGNGPGGSATSGQGFAGGTGSNSGSTFGGGGGGGGAGDVGGNGSDGVGGNGGIGKFFGTGSSYTDFGDEYGEGGYFASGAGGGSKGSTAGGIPGRGGGGYGARYYGYMGIGGSQHALPHTGGGGGGGSTPDRDQHPGYASNGDGGVTAHGGRGGSGIVLLQTNVALPNGSNTAVVQVGNPRRRSLPPTVDYMGSEVNRFSIIDSASMPTYKLPTHWYVDPIGSNSNSLYTTQGSHSLQKRADGGTSNVWYATSNHYFAEYGSYMAQTADAIFMPVEQQRYNVLLSIGSNSDNDISLRNECRWNGIFKKACIFWVN